MEVEHRGERCGGDRISTDSHRNSSHSATSTWLPDDSASFRNHNNLDNHRRADFHQHHPNYRHHQSPNPPNTIDGNLPPTPVGRKRPFPDGTEGGSFVKLYVGAVPRTVTEEEVRSVFGEYGRIVEVVLLKDKRTGQQQESCFVKYATLEEADRAIGAMNTRYTFPGGMVPIKVRYADGERERLGKSCPSGSFLVPVHKLYVGGLNKQASKWEIEEIFSAYGLVEDIYIVRDEWKQNRGSAFVQLSQRAMAIAAIHELHGKYVMRGCDQPLIVRFADPKKPRTGESRPAACGNDPFSGHILPNDIQSVSKKGLISSAQPPQTVHGQQAVLSAGIEQGLPSSEHGMSSSTETPDFEDCEWSEHICPEGNRYYYNSVTCESQWEIPEGYTFIEDEHRHEDQQHSQPGVHFTAEVPEPHAVQLQIQPSSQKSQPASSSAMEGSHAHLQPTRNPVIAPGCA